MCIISSSPSAVQITATPLPKIVERGTGESCCKCFDSVQTTSRAKMFLPTVLDLEIRAGGRLSRSWWGDRSQGSTLAAYEQFYLVI